MKIEADIANTAKFIKKIAHMLNAKDPPEICIRYDFQGTEVKLNMKSTYELQHVLDLPALTKADVYKKKKSSHVLCKRPS